MIVRLPDLRCPVADFYRHLPLPRDDDEAKAERKLLRRMDIGEQVRR